MLDWFSVLSSKRSCAKKSFLITSLILCLIVVAVIIVPSLLSKNTQTSFSSLSVGDYVITSEDGTNQDELTKV